MLKGSIKEDAERTNAEKKYHFRKSDLHATLLLFET